MSDLDRPCILFAAAMQEELDALWNPGAGFRWSDTPELLICDLPLQVRPNLAAVSRRVVQEP